MENPMFGEKRRVCKLPRPLRSVYHCRNTWENRNDRSAKWCIFLPGGEKEGQETK